MRLNTTLSATPSATALAASRRRWRSSLVFRTGHVDFDGTYYQARDCELWPRGPRSSGPPILIGSSSPRLLELLARHGDMWNTWFTSTRNSAAGFPSLMEAVNAACVAVGRDLVTLQRTATVLVSIGNGRTSTETVAPLTGTRKRSPLACMPIRMQACRTSKSGCNRMCRRPGTPSRRCWQHSIEGNQRERHQIHHSAFDRCGSGSVGVPDEPPRDAQPCMRRDDCSSTTSAQPKPRWW